MLIVNADDWGRTRTETDVALSLYRQGRITSVSAMVFMEDSHRAADIAKDEGIDAGLHLNFSQGFTGRVPGGPLRKCHDRIARFLSISKYALIFYNPGLRQEFLYDYQAQLEEFHRLYGRAPSHFDGHQHMHLCTNMLLNRVISPGEKVRRNFSFWPGEKDFLNRSYRHAVDMWLARRYRLTDFFFALSQCLDIGRRKRIGKLAKNAAVELMTHPIKPKEYAFLMSDEYLAMIGNGELAHIRRA
jgi:predicted glycoside hydrolase/deacetylase ChbG (UPF0249 family)